jgi:hypothetical protein
VRSASNRASGCCSVGSAAEEAVGELVADVGEFGRREMTGEFERRDPAHVRPVAGVEHIGEGDLLAGARHLQRDVIMLREQGELIAQIIGEQVGARHRGDESTRTLELAEGEVVCALPLALFAGGDEADRRIVEQPGRGSIGRRQRAVADIGGDGRFEIGNRGAEAVLQLGDDPFNEGGGIGGGLR